MTATIPRRAFLAAALIGSTALAACTAASSSGTDTVTINVSEFVSDATLAISVAETVLAFSPLPAAATTTITTAANLIRTGLASLQTYAGSSVTLTLNTTSIPAAVSSLIADIKQAAALIASIASSYASAIASTTITKISSVAGDVANVASVLQSAITPLVGARVGVSDAQSRALVIDGIRARNGV